MNIVFFTHKLLIVVLLHTGWALNFLMVSLTVEWLSWCDLWLARFLKLGSNLSWDSWYKPHSVHSSTLSGWFLNANRRERKLEVRLRWARRILLLRDVEAGGCVREVRDMSQWESYAEGWQCSGVSMVYLLCRRFSAVSQKWRCCWRLWMSSAGCWWGKEGWKCKLVIVRLGHLNRQRSNN